MTKPQPHHYVTPGDAIPVMDPELTWIESIDCGSRNDVEHLTIEDVRGRPLRREWS